jgi:hypothetical protein
VSLNAGQDAPTSFADDPADGAASSAVVIPATGGVPAWMHFAAVWSIALVSLIAVVVFYATGVKVPAALLTIAGTSVGGALGITLPSLGLLRTP